jgi:hypothetical protein
VTGRVLDGPYNVRPKSAGEYFVAAGESIPMWFPAQYESMLIDAIISVDLEGVATMYPSLGAAEHR